ncbi:MAG: STAS domain-containing protein [Vicinamibacteria bacterium]
MKINERQAGDISILDVEGRIVSGDGEEPFRDAVTRLMEAGRVKLILNLAEVPYIDSAGVSQLVRTFVTTSKRSGGMKLLNVTRRVRELLTITRLLSIWEAFDSEEKAVESFPKPAGP